MRLFKIGMNGSTSLSNVVNQCRMSRPQDKYQGPPGIFSIVEWLLVYLLPLFVLQAHPRSVRTDEVFKGAAYFAETLLDSSTSHSFLPIQSAFNKAFDVDVDVFEWYERPDNELRFRRFSMAMAATRGLSPADTIMQGIYRILNNSRVIHVLIIFQASSGHLFRPIAMLWMWAAVLVLPL